MIKRESETYGYSMCSLLMRSRHRLRRLTYLEELCSSIRRIRYLVCIESQQQGLLLHKCQKLRNLTKQLKIVLTSLFSRIPVEYAEICLRIPRTNSENVNSVSSKHALAVPKPIADIQDKQLFLMPQMSHKDIFVAKFACIIF